VKLGFSLVGIRPRWYTAVAQHAEARGFESVWFGEHLVLPAELPATYLYADDGRAPLTPDTAMYDAWIMLAGIATATTTLRLGTNVYVLPLRHPLITARSVITLDRLSGGRVTLGAGIGWLESEYQAVGIPWSERGSRMDEIVPLLRRLWSEPGPLEHRGRHYDFGPVSFYPKAIQRPSVPIEIGGTSPAALRRAAVLGDGWFELGSRDIHQMGSRVAELQRLRAAAGRTGPFEITSSFSAPEDVSRCEDLGVTRVITGFPGFTAQTELAEVLRWMDVYADEVGARAPVAASAPAP
jgi:probable F420-dependent oxidoreductase